MFIPAFFMYLLCLILFYTKDLKKLKSYLDKIVFAKNFLKSISDKEKKIQFKQSKFKSNDKTSSRCYPMGLKGANQFKKKALVFPGNKKNNINNINNQSKNEEIIIKKNKPNSSLNLFKLKNVNNPINLIKGKTKNEINSQNKKSAPPPKNLFQIINQKKKQNKTSNIIAPNLSSFRSNILKNKSKLQLNLNNFANKNKINGPMAAKQQRARIDKILELNDSELNSLGFMKALKLDKRGYIQYYFSLLKTGHLVIKIFNHTDYNSPMIKLFLCIFNFCMNFAVNALFFSDETMHKILEDEGEFNILYQLPQIIYSTVICFIFEYIIDFFALSEDTILEVKQEKKLGTVRRFAKTQWRSMEIKFIYFFIISFVFLGLFWYYVACFCAVYKNTQYHLIKDTLFSFGTGLITPLGVQLLPGLFRIPAIKRRNELMFLFSKIFQLFG